MNVIIGLIASVLGFLMDFFFQALTFIGYPRLWACIVLFATATRFLFLPQRISSYRGKLLTPIAKQELLAADPNFFEKTKNLELTAERAARKKEVYKKYKIANNLGCLTTLIQYPLLIALFYIVKNPQEFIPSLEALSTVSPEVNSLFGVSLAAVPMASISSGESFLILGVPVLVMLSNVIKMFRSLRRAKTASQKIKVYALCGAFTLLLGWFSASLPLAISLYWIANDVTYHIFDVFIHKFVPKSKFVASVLDEYKQKLKQQAETTSTVTDVSDNPVSANENHDAEKNPVSTSEEDNGAIPV